VIPIVTKAGGARASFTPRLALSQCYVDTGKPESAMDLYKSLGDKIGKEEMDASFVLDFAKILKGCHEHCLALEVLEDHLGIIEGFWHKLNQGKSYNSMACHYNNIYDFKSNRVLRTCTVHRKRKQ